MRSLWQARSNPLAWRWAFLTLSSNVNALCSGGLARGSRRLRPLEGLRDASTRWVVTHDFAQWKDEIAWMSLYFIAAVWASLALCPVYSLGDYSRSIALSLPQLPCQTLRVGHGSSNARLWNGVRPRRG